MRLKALAGPAALLAAAAALTWMHSAAAQAPQTAPAPRTPWSPLGSESTGTATAPSGLPDSDNQPRPSSTSSRWSLFGRLFHRNTQPAPTVTPVSGTVRDPKAASPTAAVIAPAAAAPVPTKGAPGQILLDDQKLTPVAVDATPKLSQVQAHVRAACGGKAHDVQVHRKTDGSLVVRVFLNDEKAQDEVLKKVMQVPEMSGANVHLEIEVNVAGGTGK
jgi:hypothetical protein